MTTKIEEAQTTCEGLQRLIRRLNGAAVDLDKGGESAHELLALLASTTVCINNLSSQLQSLESIDSNVSIITPNIDEPEDSHIPQRVRAVAGR